MYYNKKGEPLDMLEWAKLFKNPAYKIVKQETLPSGIFVSTVWLGLCHNFLMKGKPIIFETMVFPKKKGEKRESGTDDWSELDQNRYSTLEEAKKGHKEMVKKYINEK